MDSSSPSKPRAERHPDNQITLRNILMALGLTVSIVSVYYAYKALKASTAAQESGTATQRKLKEIDLRQSFQKRYDDLTDETKSKVKSQQDAETHYRRFWRLQLEEYQYWCDGMIDESLYDTWTNSRRYEWKSNPSFVYEGGSYNYKQGWDYMKDYFTKRDQGNHTQYERFIKFFDNIIFGSETTRPNPRDHCAARLSV